MQGTSMARVAACFALSAVLMLAIGIGSATGQLPPPPPVETCNEAAARLYDTFTDAAKSLFSSAKPMRIVSKDGNLSMAVDGKGDKVLLATTSCTAANQVWFRRFPVGNENKFALVSAVTTGLDPRAMSISKVKNDDPVLLEPYKGVSDPTWPVPQTMLWEKRTTKDGDGGYYEIDSYAFQRYILVGLNGPATEGTVVGAIRDDDVRVRPPTNHLWKIQEFA